MSYQTAFQDAPDGFQESAFQIVLVLPPVNIILPTITGIAQVGQILVGGVGTWINFPTSFTYQWQQDGTTNIVGATSSTYLITAADVSHTLNVVVTAYNAGGSGVASSLPTTIVAPVTPPVQQSAAAGGGGGLKGSESKATKRFDTTQWQKIEPAHKGVFQANTAGVLLGLGTTRFRVRPIFESVEPPQSGRMSGFGRPTLYPFAGIAKFSGSANGQFEPTSACLKLRLGTVEFLGKISDRQTAVLVRQVQELRETLADVLEVMVARETNRLFENTEAFDRIRTKHRRTRLQAAEEQLLFESNDANELLQGLLDLSTRYSAGELV